METAPKQVDENYDRRAKAADEIFCGTCGAIIKAEAEICPKCGVRNKAQATSGVSGKSPKTRLAYILLGLFLGGFGVHNFYIGRIGVGVGQLLLTLCLGWMIFPLFFIGLWILLEVIMISKDSEGRTLS